MQTLPEAIAEAESKHVAIGHFNISDTEGLWAIFHAARSLNVPVIIGVSEGERKFIGVRQAAALVRSLRDEFKYPIFLNADHTYSVEGVKEAIDAGFDAAIYDGAKLPIAENIEKTKQCVKYARERNPEMLIEGEIGFIGESSKLFDTLPENVELSTDRLTKPEEARAFVEATGVDLLAPAVGNFHGMLKGGSNPHIDVERAREIRKSAGVPLVLHGGSGIPAEDFTAVVQGGVAIVHVNTELRVAYRKGIERAFNEAPDEVAPYRFLKEGVAAMSAVVTEHLCRVNRLSRPTQ